MKTIKFFSVATIISFCLFSCQKNLDTPSNNEEIATRSSTLQSNDKGTAGYVYTLSNQIAGNSLLAYSRSSDGMISFMTAYPTGGTGTGGGLGNQGAVILSDDNNWLIAVNPGSNSVASFAVSGGSLQWKSTVSSGGTTPVSVTMYNDLVYVLNAGGEGNISGFRIHADGTLHSIANSTKPLSSSASGAAQVSFVASGSVLVVTEKATNKIISYTVDGQGLPGMMHSITSAHPTPFGFAVGKNGVIYVSEAAGGAPDISAVSSYHVSTDGNINLVEGPVFAGQTAACWVVVTNNGKYVYATNTGSNNVSSFSADQDGSISVLSAVAVMTGIGSTPIDAALSVNSKFMYVLNSGNESIGVFAVKSDGSLSDVQNLSGLPNGATGMAAK